jgi:hypothetical protein
MGGFLLARVGKPRTMTAGKQTTGLVQLSDLAAAISAVRVDRTDKPWPIPAKAAWRPRNRELLLRISPVATVRTTSVFQGYAMSFRLDLDRRHPFAILLPSPWEPPRRSKTAAPVPVQHIDAAAALDSGLSAARVTRHLLLRFSSPYNRNRLAILILTQANPFSHDVADQFWSRIALSPEMSPASRSPAILNQLAEKYQLRENI